MGKRTALILGGLAAGVVGFAALSGDDDGPELVDDFPEPEGEPGGHQVDVPPPPPKPSSRPSNVHTLDDPADFADLDRVIERVGKATEPFRQTVVLGYSRSWTGLDVTLERLDEVASHHPTVRFLLFSFRDSHAALGKPDSYLAYLLTAVNPVGAYYAQPRVGKHGGDPAVGEFPIAAMAQWAATQPPGEGGNPEKPGGIVMAT